MSFPNDKFFDWFDYQAPVHQLLSAIFGESQGESQKISQPGFWPHFISSLFSSQAWIHEPALFQQVIQTLESRTSLCAECGQTSLLHIGHGLCHSCHIDRDYQDWAREKLQAEAPAPRTWADYQRRALIWHAFFQPEQALADCNQALELNPTEPELYLLRARLRYALDRKEDCIHADCAQSLALQPDSVPLLGRWANLYRDKLLDREKALELFHQALALDPGNLDLMEAIGEMYLATRSKETLPWAGRIIQQFPTESVGYRLKAHGLVKDGCFEPILAVAKTAVRQADCADSYFLLSWCQSQLKDTEAALNSYNRALEYIDSLSRFNPTRKALWQKHQLAKHGWDKAWQEYKEQELLISFDLLELEPLRSWLIQFYSGQIEERVDDSAAWLPFLLRGRLQNIAGEKEAAISDYSASLELNPLFPRTWYHRAVCLNLSQPREALADLNRYLELDPYEEDGYHQRAICQVCLDDLEAARPDLLQALSLNPCHDLSVFKLAWVNQLQNQPEAMALEPILTYEQALSRQIEHTDGFIPAYRLRQKLQFSQQRYKE